MVNFVVSEAVELERRFFDLAKLLQDRRFAEAIDLSEELLDEAM